MRYIEPEFNVIVLDAEDIITASLAKENSDNTTEVDTGWWD